MLILALSTWALMGRAAAHTPERQAPGTPPVWCTVAAEQPTVTVGEPLWLRMECENRSAVERDLDFQTGSGVGWHVSPEMATLACFPLSDVQNVPPGRVAISVGSHVTIRALLNRWSGMMKPGSYRLRLVDCAGAFNRDFKGGPSLSNEVAFSVLPLDEQRLERICKDLEGQALDRAAPTGARLQAAEALSWVDLPLAVPYLHAVMLEARNGVSALAVQGLGRMGSPQAVRVLVEAYEKDPFLGMTIATTLYTMHPTGLDAELQGRVNYILQHPIKIEH